MNIKIGMCGLTHLGLVYGSVFSKNFHCVLYDHRSKQIEKLKRNDLEIKEKNLKNLLIKNKKNISFTNDFNDIFKCDIIFISADIKTNSKGKSDYSLINTYIKKIKKKINKKQTLIILSQLKPGFCNKLKSELKSELIYFVETLVFGNAVDRALHPERIILGTNHKISRKANYFFNKFQCPILKMNYESAELTKISINLFLVSSVTTTNLISSISKSIGADWNEIRKALTLDKRIGKFAYLSPGLGISGGNLERDLNSIIEIGKKKKISTKLISLWQNMSTLRKNWISDNLRKIIKINKVRNVGILGLTYKPGTNSIKNSPSLMTIKKNTNILFKYHDPKADILKLKNLKFCSINECCKNVKILIIATPWPIYSKSKLEDKILKNKIKYLIDPFKVLKFKNKNKKNIKYLSL